MLKWLLTWALGLILVCSSYAGGPEYSKFGLEKATRYKLNSIAEIIPQNPEEAIKQLDGLIKYAIQEDLPQSLSYSYYLMGTSYTQLQQPQLALHFMGLAKEIYLQPKDESRKSIGNTSTSIPDAYYQVLGEIYTQLQQFEEANVQFNRFKERSNNSSLIRATNYALAQNEYALENYTQAIAYYQDLLAEEIQLKNDMQIRVCYSRLAACYISIDDTEKGLVYYRNSLQGIEEQVQLQSEEMKESSGYNSLSNNKEVVSKALRKQNKVAEELELRSNMLSIIADNMEHLRLAQLYMKEGNVTETEKSLDQYFANISYNLIDAKEIEVIREMALSLKERNNPEKAFDYLIRFEELSDTIRDRLATLAQTSSRVGTMGFQNSLQLEILRKNKEISDNTIGLLMRESALKEENLKSQQTIIFLLGAVVFIVISALVYIIKVSQQRRIANQQLALRSLRTQMNPHFIFNALNSVNSFISVSDERSANRFLSEFSTLMRTVMENSEHDFIPLTKEIEILEIYVGLEHFRFQDKFEYSLDIDPSLDTEDLVIPPMLIQPYVENAIWHGLRYKETKGVLHLSIWKETNHLKVVIQDDGIGRQKSAEVKTKNQRKTSSTALKNIQERVTLFNQLHRLKIGVEIANLNENGTGTVVTLIIPQPQL